MLVKNSYCLKLVDLMIIMTQYVGGYVLWIMSSRPCLVRSGGRLVLIRIFWLDER